MGIRGNGEGTMPDTPKCQEHYFTGPKTGQPCEYNASWYVPMWEKYVCHYHKKQFIDGAVVPVTNPPKSRKRKGADHGT